MSCLAPIHSEAYKHVQYATDCGGYFCSKTHAVVAIALSILNVALCPLKGIGEAITHISHLKLGSAIAALAKNIWDGVKSFILAVVLVNLLAISFFSFCGNVFSCLKDKTTPLPPKPAAEISLSPSPKQSVNSHQHTASSAIQTDQSELKRQAEAEDAEVTKAALAKLQAEMAQKVTDFEALKGDLKISYEEREKLTEENTAKFLKLQAEYELNHDVNTDIVLANEKRNKSTVEELRSQINELYERNEHLESQLKHRSEPTSSPSTPQRTSGSQSATSSVATPGTPPLLVARVPPFDSNHLDEVVNKYHAAFAQLSKKGNLIGRRRLN